MDAGAWGGAETYVARLVHELAGRITPVVITSDPVPPRLRDALPAGVPLRTVEGVGRKGNWEAIIRLIGAVRATKPDVVHVNQSTPAHNRYGLLAARLSGAASVATVHSPEPVRSGPQKLLLPILYRGVRAVVAVSNETRDLLVDTLGVDPAVVRVMLNGVPVPDPPAGSRATRADTLCIGSLGRLVTEKAFDVLIDALALVFQEHPQVQLQIAGDGPERAALQARAAGLPVRLVGEITDPPAFLRELDIFCLSSRREGLPFALLEAMAMGVPCVATDVGQIRSALGDAVLIVPAGQAGALSDALQGLVDDPAARAALGDRGRALIRARHDVRLMAASTMELYQNAVSAAAPRPRRRTWP
jgi:glycosyltransferase involved in cell wall biosynthesis